jgi:IclR family transcriptional regulator, pca regulon regulatory protein
MTDYKPIKSLLKGLKLLEVFTYQDYMLGFQEIVLKTKMPKATVFRLLHTLTSEDYLYFDSKLKKYFMSPRVMSLGSVFLSGLKLREVALPYLEELSRVCGQNVNLTILDGKEILYVEHISKRDLLKINIQVGSRVNVYQTASGRAILAHLTPGRLQWVLEELLADPDVVKTIGVKGDKLMMRLAEVRRQGYALNDEEFTKGVRSIAAPIFDRQGGIEGAVNMPVFSHQVSVSKLIKTYLPMLLDATGKISAARGFIKRERTGADRATETRKRRSGRAAIRKP